ncbi:hypothetical protein EUX98_g6086 [Antrodiella citrinella]|uniref:Uncharacterized protein n=1 Tax=Antrodiella citrinella TaxID=2447956 RepID=A0A4S4MS14_9APHY|nr:hypothetical protein EUX98_g6086 [Antrodiella citrinella]
MAANNGTDYLRVSDFLDELLLELPMTAVAYAVSGAYLWEFLTSLDFEWSFIMQRKAVTWPMISYFAGRYLALFTVCVAIYGNVPPTPGPGLVQFEDPDSLYVLVGEIITGTFYNLWIVAATVSFIGVFASTLLLDLTVFILTVSRIRRLGSFGTRTRLLDRILQDGLFYFLLVLSSGRALSGCYQGGPFSVVGIPKLEESIPAQYFPDTLIVHDPHGVSMACDGRYYDEGSLVDVAGTSDFFDDEGDKVYEGETGYETHKTDDAKKKRTAFVYKRVYPTLLACIATKAQHAEKGQDGSMSHTAHLYMEPKHRMGTGHHSHLAPVQSMKLAIQQRNAREILASEAKTYNDFPAHLSDEYCGYHLLSPFMQTLSPSCAVVPKFFGYYVPVYEPEDFGTSATCQCYSLLMRLHINEIIHQSFCERNIVVQPGPLTKPPIARSLKTPSFRVIDFGRSMSWKQWLKSMREKDLARYKAEQEAIEKGERVHIPSWDKCSTRCTMMEAETSVQSVDENPYWQSFESNLKTDWRRARRDLLFKELEVI